MCGIKDKAGSIIQWKISDIPLVQKTGPATTVWPSIKISSSISICSVRFISVTSLIFYDID